MNILHLLSWYPTPENPMNGNFCLKQIASVSDRVDSVALTVVLDEKATTKELEVIEHPNFKHIYIHLRPYHGPLSRLVNKFRIFNSYNWGLKYVKKHFFVPDLVHQHVTLPVGRIAHYWKKRHGIPYVLTEHWTIYQPQNRAMMTPKMQETIRKIANNASRILPVSHDLQKNMQGYGITAPFKVIPNVVDTDIFVQGEKACDGRKHILHISTLRDEAKNFSGILRVIQRLAAMRNDFVLDVVHDYRKPEFERFVHDNHLEEFVVFHGPKTEKEITEFYARADFFLLFSNFENLPCVLIESFACGLPVVTTDVGGICEIVDESRGRIVAAGDEEALYQSVDYMLDHFQDYDSAAIRRYAVEHFSKKEIGNLIWEAYQTVKN